MGEEEREGGGQDKQTNRQMDRQTKTETKSSRDRWGGREGVGQGKKERKGEGRERQTNTNRIWRLER